jgi:hypothetical protein
VKAANRVRVEIVIAQSSIGFTGGTRATSSTRPLGSFGN